MRNRGSIFRYVFICFICCFLIGYNIYGVLFTGNTAKKESTFPGIKNQEFAFFEEKNNNFSRSSLQSGQTSFEQKEEKSEDSVATSVSAVVKGKIISKFIDPRSASLSYNNVYIKNSTDLNIEIRDFLNSKLDFKISKKSNPEVLIMHTHTTETFMSEDSEYYTESYNSRTRDKDKNMIKIGEIVNKKLKDAGICSIHDTTEHDYPKYSGSYTRAAKTINQYLKKYPSIKIVLDLHRDAVTSGDSDKVKLVTEIDGKKAAQVMIVMGSQSGSVTNFPDWKENFKLAVKLQQVLEVKYPTLARPLSLMSKNYNESLTKGSLLIEFGTDANTLEEASYSAEMVGDSIASLLNTLN